ncbi:hypothetical protein OQA88_10334 [Cercophora sp. LCS_1]
MRPGSFLGSSRPRRPSSDNDSFASTASTHHHSASLDQSDVLMTPPASASEEESDVLLAANDHYGDLLEGTDDVEEREAGRDAEGEDEDEDEDLCFGHHHEHDHLHHTDGNSDYPYPYTQHPQSYPYNHQPHAQSSFADLDGYASDDLNMLGAPAVPSLNYPEAASSLSGDMNLDAPADAAGGVDASFTDPLPGYQPGYPPDSIFLSNTQLHHLPAASAALGFPNYFSIPTHPSFPMFFHPSVTQATLDPEGDEAGSSWFEGAHPVALSNPSPHTLGPGNYNLPDFLHHWARHSRSVPGLSRERGRYPWPSRIHALTTEKVKRIRYADLEGDVRDFQGIDWDDLGVTRKEARERRLLTYNNYVNQPGSDRWTPNLPDVVLPRTESYFRFRRMDIQHDVTLSHFQLRNVLAGSSRTGIFYPGMGSVYHFNPVTGKKHVIISDNHGSQVSTVAADHGVLIAGYFNGEYILRCLDSNEPESLACHDGLITTNLSGITNHVQIHYSRSPSTLVAAFASNDMIFRTLDIATETWLSHQRFRFPLNCTALSPDRRLRVMVGDDQHVLIAAAESTLPGGRPEILKALPGHRDYGFACDWADDGWTVATGFQDKSIKIWDARKWSDNSGGAAPVCTLRTEMAGVRGLRFSPIGSGKRVLVAAEEADFINIIDAQTFRSRQTVDIFGEIGGVQFTNDGQDLNILCCDRARGGLLQLERCGLGQKATWNSDEEFSGHRDNRWYCGTNFDWQPSVFTKEKHVKESLSRRRRKGADSEDIEPF